jgi:glycosyltransferase involved in cell wall biosynthesis
MFLRKELSKTSNISDLIYKLSQKITIYITKICKFRIFTNKIDVNYLRNRGIKGSMVKVLPGGVDNINLIPNKKYDACFIGRIHPQKGIPVLLKIWKKFIQKNPQAILAFICSGNKEEVVSLKNQIKKLGLQSNIKFFGFLDNQDKLQVLANSKMFLFPSSYESFGITVLEALSLKIPVVSFDLDAVKINFKEGVLISKNEKEFLTNILRLSGDSELRDSLGKLGYKLSLNFSWKKIATQFLNDLV